MNLFEFRLFLCVGIRVVLISLDFKPFDDDLRAFDIRNGEIGFGVFWLVMDQMNLEQ